MAGTAKWCLGDVQEAVRQWNAGLKAQYADTAGLGLQLPLLLFVASVLRPATFEKTKAEDLLRSKIRDCRARTWPGPIAGWVLAEFQENELRDRCRDANETESRNHYWLTDFYRAIVLHSQGQATDFRDAMRRLVDTSRPEWSDENFFLSRMWGEEFFLARHEATRAAVE